MWTCRQVLDCKLYLARQSAYEIPSPCKYYNDFSYIHIYEASYCNSEFQKTGF